MVSVESSIVLKLLGLSIAISCCDLNSRKYPPTFALPDSIITASLVYNPPFAPVVNTPLLSPSFKCSLTVTNNPLTT